MKKIKKTIALSTELAKEMKYEEAIEKKREAESFIVEKHISKKPRKNLIMLCTWEAWKQYINIQ